MITDGLTRVNNSDVCINDDGFGYATEGASRCAPGFWATKGSRRPCLQCRLGRSTTDIASQQRTISDCRVRPGWGIVNSGSNGDGSTSCADAFNPDVTGLNSTQLAALSVLECPIGYYNGNFTVDGKCQACPAGSSTQQPGSTNVTDCNGECTTTTATISTELTPHTSPAYGSWCMQNTARINTYPNTTNSCVPTFISLQCCSDVQ